MYTFKEMIDELFCADIKLSKKEKEILNVLETEGALNFYDLMEIVDIKPSRFNKHFFLLEGFGFVTFDEETEITGITVLGEKALQVTKKGRKQKRKMLDLINSFNDEELEEFKQLFEETVSETEPVEE